MRRVRALSAVLALLAFLPLAGCQTESVVSRSTDAAEILRDFSLGGAPIPSAELASAKGIAVIKETEGGVIVGGRGGKGILVRKMPDGKWSAPIAVDTGGLSFGAQIGMQGGGLVLVFQSDTAVDQAVHAGDFPASAAQGSFGPWGGGVQDSGGGVKAYTKSGGLYGGATLGNLKFSVNQQANSLTYGGDATVDAILSGKRERPLGTGQFYRLIPESSAPVRSASASDAAGK